MFANSWPAANASFTLEEAEKLRRVLAIFRPPDLYPRPARIAYYQLVHFFRSIAYTGANFSILPSIRCFSMNRQEISRWLRISVSAFFLLVCVGGLMGLWLGFVAEKWMVAGWNYAW